MFLRNLLTALKAPHKRAMYAVMRDGKSMLRIYFLYAARQSGLAMALQGPRTLEELGDFLQVKRPEFLLALLDLGRALGEIQKKESRFLAKGHMLRLLGKEEGADFSALPEAFSTYYNSVYCNLPERMAGAPSGDYLPLIGNIVARFSRMIEPYVLNLLREAIPAKGEARILDLGCGSGGYLNHASGLNPSCAGIGLESDPAVAEQASRNLADWGLAERFQIKAGDIRTQSSELGHFDATLCINNLYYFSPEERGDIYRLLGDMLNPEGTLAIACSFQGGGRDIFTANLNAATVSIRGCWPLPELETTVSLLKEAGFRAIKTSRLMPGSSVYGILAKH